MQKFKFKLANLLEYRRQEEQIAKKNYALAQQAVQHEKDKVATLLQEKYKIFTYATNDVKLLQAQRQYLMVLEQQIIATQEQEKKCQLAVATALDGLIIKQQACQVVEKLYAKKFAEYQAEVKRQEQIFLDELGTQNYLRQQGN